MILNLQEIFNSQKLLDQSISKAHNIIVNDEIIDKQIIALLVEIGEFSNEIKTFKYWKKDQKRDETKILEEYADVIHFFISLGIKYNMNPQIEVPIFQEDINTNIIHIYNNIMLFWQSRSLSDLESAFKIFLSLVQWLGYEYKTILDSYYKKMQINFERIQNNY
ncbi:dUTP diphosphatase [Mycoplasma iguanae]|uniref:dUTP diphosphatase n=1 Tax=Mycoplasma iguanae TaxID=292461 RepID=A0ABY5R8V6_9MOLU|nr:dUTP diphosphatase [Mycoplasma iguanae]UVD81868.1 dUTP diphosphatase [Mycoplasma iguanae]